MQYCRYIFVGYGSGNKTPYAKHCHVSLGAKQDLLPNPGSWVIMPPGEHPGKIVPHRRLINTVNIVQQLQTALVTNKRK